MDALLYSLRDRKTTEVLAIKSNESKIFSIITSIQDVLDDLASDITELNDVNASSALQSAEASYQDVLNHLSNVLGGNLQVFTASFISALKADQEYSGFNSFSLQDYPLTNAEVFVLSTLSSLVDSLDSLVSSLFSFEGVDISGVLTRLTGDNAELRNEIDVLTNQIQNLSTAPLLSLDTEPFIPGVQPSQLTNSAIDVLDGADNRLDFGDVVTNFPTFNADIQFILESLSSSGVDITADLVRQISSSVNENILNSFQGTEQEKLFYNAFRTDGAQGTAGDDGNDRVFRALNFHDADGTNLPGVPATLSLLSDSQSPITSQYLGSGLSAPKDFFTKLSSIFTDLSIDANNWIPRLTSDFGPDSSFGIPVQDLQGWATANSFIFFIARVQPFPFNISILNTALSTFPTYDQASIPFIKGIVNPNFTRAQPIDEEEVFQAIANSINNG